jgi:signal transduction histidine kinase
VRLRQHIAGGDRELWLIALFLLIGVVAPTACVLWFMNEAAAKEIVIARHTTLEAYRGQMRVERDRLDAFWAERAQALENRSAQRGATNFEHIVTGGLADSAIILDARGNLAYPAPPVAVAFAPLGSTSALERQGRLREAAAAYAQFAATEQPELAACAAQSQIRCLLRLGDQAAALSAIRQHFLNGRLSLCCADSFGRLIPADEQLLYLKLTPRSDPERMPVAQRLGQLLNDYEYVSMPSSQRLFLIGELRTIKLHGTVPVFPLEAAERLAAEVLDSDVVRPGEPALERTRVPEVWRLTTGDGRVVALYRTSTIMAAIDQNLDAHNPFPGKVRYLAIPRGEVAKWDGIAAGPMLPGWQISFLPTSITGPRGTPLTAYTWVGFLVVAGMALGALLAVRAIYGSWRLARLKTDLVAAVSHELKSPLASMRLLVDALLEDQQLDPVKTRDYLKLISADNLRLSRLIENFLTFSRIERNRQRFEFADADPGEIVTCAVQSMRDRLQPPACHLEVQVAPDLPAVHGDESALVTALLNLLDNAHKYTPGDKHISVRAYRENGNVVLAVKDNGIGIAPREQKRIFRRFYQVDRRLARETGGCGLGLSIVEFIVRAHGGAVRVNSRSGAGSTFSMLLPCEPVAREADG